MKVLEVQPNRNRSTMRKSHAPPPPSSDIEISNVTNWQELATSQRCSFYGIPYIYSTENKWLQIISDYVKMSFVDHGGDLKSRYKLIAILSSGEVLLNYAFRSSTRTCTKGTFVKWFDDKSVHGVRFAKENIAEEFVGRISTIAMDLSPYAKVKKISTTKCSLAVSM